MVSIEILKSRGVCLWAYARSQAILEGMIHEAETLIDQLEAIAGRVSVDVRAARARVFQWDWEVRSQLSLLFRPSQPVLEAFEGLPRAIRRDQNARQQIQSLCDGVALRLESLRLLLRHMDEFSAARLKMRGRRCTGVVQAAAGSRVTEPVS